MSNKTVYFGSDHTGFELKKILKEFVVSLGYEAVDLGNVIYDKDDDYPDYIFPVAQKVAEDPDNNRGIIFGGSGQGEAMAANRVKGVRTALFYGPVIAKQGVDVTGRVSSDPYEIVRLSRLHNYSNILSLGVRFLSNEEAKQAVKIWLETEFINEERHLRRINKIDE